MDRRHIADESQALRTEWARWRSVKSKATLESSKLYRRGKIAESRAVYARALKAQSALDALGYGADGFAIGGAR